MMTITLWKLFLITFNIQHINLIKTYKIVYRHVHCLPIHSYFLDQVSVQRIHRRLWTNWILPSFETNNVLHLLHLYEAPLLANHTLLSLSSYHLYYEYVYLNISCIVSCLNIWPEFALFHCFYDQIETFSSGWWDVEVLSKAMIFWLSFW